MQRYGGYFYQNVEFGFAEQAAKCAQKTCKVDLFYHSEKYSYDQPEGNYPGAAGNLSLVVRQEPGGWKVIARTGDYYPTEKEILPLQRYPRFGQVAIPDSAMSAELRRLEDTQRQAARVARVSAGLAADSPAKRDITTAIAVAQSAIREGFSSLNPVLVNQNISAAPVALPLRQYYYARYLAQAKGGLSAGGKLAFKVEDQAYDCHNYYCVIRLQTSESAPNVSAARKFYTVGVQKENLVWKVVSLRQDADPLDAKLA